MEKRKLVNVVVVITAVVLIAVLAFTVRFKVTADRIVVLSASGISCGSCAEKIVAALEQKKGVSSVYVDVAASHIIIGFDSNRTRPEVLAEAATAIGFGSSILQLMTPEEYKALTGRAMDMPAQKKGCRCCTT